MMEIEKYSQSEGTIMNEPTLESLAQRIDALERELRMHRATETKKDWRRVVGIAGDSELMREIDDEGRRIREAEREDARREPTA
jgi:translation initiation factor 2B subunit (eIF-2B alpha/beta/delta family)